MNELIINGIDHSVFNLEWAKRGGIMLGRDTSDFTCNFARIIHRSINTTNDKERYTIVEFFKMSPKKGCVVFVANNYYTDDIRNSFRMATPQECEDAGVEYIEPPARWLPIDSAPKDGRIIEVADFRVVVANECPLSKHWKFWRDIPHPLNKNSMTQPQKDE